jgi:hypothetical protein
MREAIVSAVVTSALVVGGVMLLGPRAKIDDVLKKQDELKVSVKEANDKLNRLPSNPRFTLLVLSRASADCDTAKVVDNRVGNKNDQPVHWQIVDTCGLTGSWQVELDFEPQGGKFPFPTQKVRSKGTVFKFINERIKNSSDAPPNVYPYKIGLVRGDIITPLADPELEVEPPVRVIQ